jgi:hypothetical protein
MTPDTYYDEFDIAMDWFYEPVDGANDWTPGGESEEYDENEALVGLEDESEDEDDLELDEEDSEDAEDDGEGPDSFDLATGEVAEDFKELALPWWLETAYQGLPEPPSMGITTPEMVGSQMRYVQRFANATQFLNYIYSEPQWLSADEHKLRFSTRASKTNQVLGLTWESARTMADRGWPEGVAAVDRIASKLKRVISGAIRTPVTSYGIRGPKIDMGKFLTGDPRHMLVMSESERMKESKKPKLIRIVTTVDIAGQEGFINRGAAICALTQLMQRHGIRVQVDVHVGTDDLIDTWVRVKDAERGIDMESLVFYSAHPVMFWRYAYAAWEHAPREYRGDVGTTSMGFISEPHESDRGDIYVSARGSRWINKEDDVLKWVVEQLQENGIEVELEGVKKL